MTEGTSPTCGPQEPMLPRNAASPLHQRQSSQPPGDAIIYAAAEGACRLQNVNTHPEQHVMGIHTFATFNHAVQAGF